MPECLFIARYKWAWLWRCVKILYWLNHSTWPSRSFLTDHRYGQLGMIFYQLGTSSQRVHWRVWPWVFFVFTLTLFVSEFEFWGDFGKSRDFFREQIQSCDRRYLNLIQMQMYFPKLWQLAVFCTCRILWVPKRLKSVVVILPERVPHWNTQREISKAKAPRCVEFECLAWWGLISSCNNWLLESSE